MQPSHRRLGLRRLVRSCGRSLPFEPEVPLPTRAAGKRGSGCGLFGFPSREGSDLDCFQDIFSHNNVAIHGS